MRAHTIRYERMRYTTGWWAAFRIKTFKAVVIGGRGGGGWEREAKGDWVSVYILSFE